jgi:hypothetical protein
VAARTSASVGLNVQAVVVVDVAGSAGHGGVAVSERKAECGVIECAIGPFGDGMALRAGRGGVRKSCFDVIRNIAAICRCFVPIGEMATDAIS